MGIEVFWDDQTQSAVRFRFDARWTWDDFYQARQKSYDMVDSVSYPVAVMFDAPPDITLPSNFLSQATSLFKQKHPRTQLIILVGANAYVRVLMDLLGKFADRRGNTIRACATLDEARSVVRAWSARHRQLT